MNCLVTDNVRPSHKIVRRRKKPTVPNETDVCMSECLNMKVRIFFILQK